MNTEVIERVEDIVSEYLDVDKNIVKSDSKFIWDLGGDFFDIIHIAYKLEEEFNIEFSEEDVSRVQKVEDLIEMLS